MNSSSTNLVYVDAAGWIALVNRRDSLHTQAVRIYRQLLQEQCQLVTASVVLLEVGNWLSPAPLRGLAINLLHRIEKSSRIEVVHVTHEFYAKGWELYGNRLDKDWGVIDCISFVIMQERNLTEALTSDHHFEQAGFKILLLQMGGKWIPFGAFAVARNQNRVYLGIAEVDDFRHSDWTFTTIGLFNTSNLNRLDVIETKHRLFSFALNTQGDRIFGVDPINRRLIVLDAKSGKELSTVDQLGESPIQVLIGS